MFHALFNLGARADDMALYARLLRIAAGGSPVGSYPGAGGST